MLCELRVENLLLIERAELRLAPGLNVLTGETGAGKTVLAGALDLLLGGRARSRIVRPGAAEAYVEGVFALTEGLRRELAERVPADAEELVLGRRVSAEGPTRAYIGGRAATVGELRELAGRLLAFYGQHEHRRLALASEQLEILDAYCGDGQRARRSECAGAHAALRKLEAARATLEQDAGARERELDLLRFELSEIDAAEPDEGEELELTAERDRLRHVEGLRQAALGGAEAIAPDDGAVGAAGLLGGAERELDALAGVDPRLDALAQRYRALRLEADDLAGELRRYESSIDAPGERLAEVEDRVAALDRLKRKHGGSLAAVLEHAETCRDRVTELTGAEAALARSDEELAQAQARLDQVVAKLRAARVAAAPKLARAVRERLAKLALEGARFEVAVDDRETAGPRGGDAVEFVIAPNAGVPGGPLREVGSGGELSRIMLALLSVAHSGRGRAAGGDDQVLIFDEVDAGIGGRTARAVGEHLSVLAGQRQVLCITHLAQVASLATRHFRIAKDAAAEPARATVSELENDAVVPEIVRMLGADVGDSAAERHALELLRAA
ncbi:MAG TPA: DNA repair protein RecN [Solirubrobacteraceae bacterium]|nr:DNA repair protein RecN [Solirubrobacteraceae bacterium]